MRLTQGLALAHVIHMYKECFFESAVSKLKLLKIAMETEAKKPTVTYLTLPTRHCEHVLRPCSFGKQP